LTSMEACVRSACAVNAVEKLPRSARAQRSRTLAVVASKPISAKLQVTSAVVSPRLSSSAATEPSASGRAQHSGPEALGALTRTPCTPSTSWSPPPSKQASKMTKKGGKGEMRESERMDGRKYRGKGKGKLSNKETEKGHGRRRKGAEKIRKSKIKEFFIFFSPLFGPGRRQ
jgi:hypothetical protein